jgi:S1-C subfamily serine protease
MVWQHGWLWQVTAQETIRRPPLTPQFATPAPGGLIPRGAASGNYQPEQGYPTTSQPTIPDSVLDDLTPEERVYCAVYDKVNRSVVNITTKTAKVEMIFLEVPAEGSGSGSVLDQQGHILTNYHVVDGAHSVRVTLFNNETYDATLVGFDAVNDTAVLKINAPPEYLYPVSFGDSSRLRVGQRVFALGNPFGLERTLTTGIISSLNRSLPSRTGRTMKSIIQIDAALNRGNSGGPLLDTRGRLIGMNTAIASATGENTGVGFSIPIDTIKRVVPQLIEKGRVVRPDIGITRVYQSDAGLVIATLTPNGPAERAGLKGFRIVKETKRRGPFTTEEKKIDRSQADMVLSFNGEPVKTADEFLNQIEKHKPGQEVMIGIVRSGQPLQVKVVLGAGE